MKKSGVLFGFYLIAAAVILLLCGTGIIEGVPALKLAVPLILVPFFVSGLTKLGFTRILMPICLTVITFAHELGADHISPWLLIVATLLLAAGLNTLVPKKIRIKRKSSKSGGTFNNADPDNIKINSCFGGAEKYVESDNFKSAVIDCSFSGVALFFDKAVMSSEGAVIYIDAKFSGIELYVPRSWQVVDRLDCSLSGIANVVKNDEKPDKLILEGKVSFCGVDVKYI